MNLYRFVCGSTKEEIEHRFFSKVLRRLLPMKKRGGQGRGRKGRQKTKLDSQRWAATVELPRDKHSTAPL